MDDVYNLYLDDSGTRHPTHKRGKNAAHNYDWFAFGGFIIKESDENALRNMHSAFMEKWKITAPLHSSEIRSQNKNFQWLRGLGQPEQERFLNELFEFMSEAPVVGLACVVDRAGYKTRYLKKYDENPWMLCKTAFSVVVERAAKYAQSKGAKLRILPERCNKKEDRLLKSYYDELRAEGQPFSADTSGKYAPLSPKEFNHILYDFKTKNKSSPLAQLADLYLWPICMGGYHESNRPFQGLLNAKKLIECHVEESDWHILASKYSCFEGVTRKP